MNARIVIACTLLLGLSSARNALAQQTPITAPGAANVGANASDANKPFQSAQVGDTTRYLLQLQADGHQAGKPLPILGDEATASYRRYLKSFDHPIPEFYETTVGKIDNGGH